MWRKLTTRMVAMTSSGGVCAATSPMATNWALPAKMKTEKPCASSGGSPAAMASAPKISPKGTTPSSSGS